MQFAGYLVIEGETIKVLARTGKTGIDLKLRTTGRDGRYLGDESYFLSEPENEDLLDDLLSGEVVSL